MNYVKKTANQIPKLGTGVTVKGHKRYALNQSVLTFTFPQNKYFLKKSTLTTINF